MRGRVALLLFYIGALVVNQSHADDFPESRIRGDLEEARKKKIEINLSDIKPGKLISVNYVDAPILVYRRTESDIKYLRSRQTDQLYDPAGQNWRSSIEALYKSSISLSWVRLLMLSQPPVEKMPYRSLKEEFLVVGPPARCMIKFVPIEYRLVQSAPFLDVCGGEWFDTAGRVLKVAGSPAQPRSHRQPTLFNLYIPPHYFVSDTRLIIGLPESAVIPEVDIASLRNYLGMDATERLISAAMYNDLAEAKTALRDGAKADFYSQGKGSPFDAAILGGSIDLIELLVAAGARPTPNSREVAEILKRNEVLKLLESFEKK